MLKKSYEVVNNILKRSYIQSDNFFSEYYFKNRNGLLLFVYLIDLILKCVCLLIEFKCKYRLFFYHQLKTCMLVDGGNIWILQIDPVFLSGVLREILIPQTVIFNFPRISIYLNIIFKILMLKGIFIGITQIRLFFHKFSANFMEEYAALRYCVILIGNGLYNLFRK